MKKTGKIGKIVSIVVAILVVATVAGLLAFFTNGFTTDFQTTYVECGEDKIVGSASGYALAPDHPLSLKVVSPFKAGSAKSGYSVKVVPHYISGHDFDFTIDGNVYAYSKEKDLSAGFNINYKDDGFDIQAKGGINEVLHAVYPGKEISDCSAYVYKDMYALIITPYSGGGETTIYFSGFDEMVTRVVLDREVLVF